MFGSFTEPFNYCILSNFLPVTLFTDYTALQHQCILFPCPVFLKPIHTARSCISSLKPVHTTTKDGIQCNSFVRAVRNKLNIRSTNHLTSTMSINVTSKQQVTDMWTGVVQGGVVVTVNSIHRHSSVEQHYCSAAQLFHTHCTTANIDRNVTTTQICDIIGTINLSVQTLWSVLSIYAQ